MLQETPGGLGGISLWSWSWTWAANGPGVQL